jgi:hypothetical protein
MHAGIWEDDATCKDRFTVVSLEASSAGHTRPLTDGHPFRGRREKQEKFANDCEKYFD